jgi:hypothetical protein
MSPTSVLPVSGRYLGRSGSSQVELRIDVDGPRSMSRVSADYFHVEDGAADYAGSMCVDAPVLQPAPSLLTITGTCRSTWDTDATDVSITIPRVALDARPAPVTLCHLTSDQRVRARYECEFTSRAFRKVLIEEDVEQGVTPFESYDTGSLGAGCPPRTLTHLGAFEDAGIELFRTRERGVLAEAEVAANPSWSDAELHAAMEQNFSAFSEREQWAIWLLHARLHDRDRGLAQPTLFGLMFDKFGAQRQGCALFYAGMEGTSAPRQRIQLFTCVHELAHGFNLLHSFQKSLARPPIPSRPRSATWMAYPDLFPGGRDAFWPRFAFAFDDPELVHLRHAMREDVIMGGNPFEAGAAFEQDADDDTATPEEIGLRLRMFTQASLPLGVPVTLDMELTGTTRSGCDAPRVIGPRPGNVDIAIRYEGRNAVAFEPLLHHCRLDDTIQLRGGDKPILESAFIQYGRSGFAFQRPGRYEIRARLNAPGGVLVHSNVVHVEVRAPRGRADQAVAELAFGEQQGVLMSLVGSDAPHLSAGDDALREIVERYPKHPMSAFVRLLRATNAARAFKAVGGDGRITTRPPRPQALASILARTPGIESLRSAAAAAKDEVETQQVLTRLLPELPTDHVSRSVLDPFVRSRRDEIAVVLPRALAILPSPSSRARAAVAAAPVLPAREPIRPSRDGSY